ncbi:MAG: hypothetical protein ILA11_10880 [Butyrivibrio sp.]|nr:hypothetical protein [Butyrivibrio sp.]
MKNYLSPLKQSGLGKKILVPTGKFLIRNSAILLTGGAIACDISAVVFTYKYAPRIHEIVTDAKAALEDAHSNEDRKKIYTAAIKEAAPMVGVIMLFLGGSIVCNIANTRSAQKKLAAKDLQIATLAASAQTAITELSNFKKEAEKELGEEKVKEIEHEVIKEENHKQIEKKVQENPKYFEDIHVPEGEALLVDGITQQPFTSPTYRDDLGRLQAYKVDKAISRVKQTFDQGDLECDLTVYTDELGLRIGDALRHCGWNANMWLHDYHTDITYSLDPDTFGNRPCFVVTVAPTPNMLPSQIREYL